jgi:hypothetical protein
MTIPSIHFKYLELDYYLYQGEDKMKKYFLCTITLVITGLVITSSAVSIMHSKKNTVKSKQISITKMPTSMDMSVSVIIGPKPAIKKQIANALSRGIDVLVHHDIDENDCQNPALVTDAGLSNILIFAEYYEGVGQTGMWGRWSMDMGTTWSDDVVGFEAIPEDNPDAVSIPKLDYYQDSMAYGTWTAGPLNDAMTYYLELPSIIDPDSGWTYYYVDWSDVGSFTNFDSADVACYPYDAQHSPSAEFWGILVGTGDAPASDYNPSENNTVWLQYNVPGGGAGLWWFYNLDVDCEKMACDIDVSIHQPYFVCEYYMEADPTNNGSMFIKTPALRHDNYPNDNWIQDGSFTCFYFEDTLIPDILAIDGSIYIVGQSFEGDIVCFFSNDSGNSFQQSIVSEDAGIEAFPQVTLFGDHVICTYTRDGNLYCKISEDGGANWRDEVQINDENGSVVEQYSCTSINGPYASWTDNRAAPPTEIYIDITNTIGNPPSAPIITGPPRHGKPVLKGLLGTKPLPRPLLKPGILYNFTFNSIDPDGDQVKYIIDWGDTERNITDLYPSGQNVTVPHKWTTQGVYTIIAKAQDEHGLVGPASYWTEPIPHSKTYNSIFNAIKIIQN